MYVDQQALARMGEGHAHKRKLDVNFALSCLYLRPGWDGFFKKQSHANKMLWDSEMGSKSQVRRDTPVGPRLISMLRTDAQPLLGATADPERRC